MSRFTKAERNLINLMCDSVFTSGAFVDREGEAFFYVKDDNDHIAFEARVVVKGTAFEVYRNELSDEVGHWTDVGTLNYSQLQRWVFSGGEET